MELIDKYLGEGKANWDEFYMMAKDTSGKTFKAFEKKYGGAMYQMPHVDDALKKAKDLKDFKRMIARFEKV